MDTQEKLYNAINSIPFFKTKIAEWIGVNPDIITPEAVGDSVINMAAKIKEERKENK